MSKKGVEFNMNVKKININEINPSEYNPRKITNLDYDKLKNSINEFGLVDPIIINLKNNRIIGGHQRYAVLLNEGYANADLNLIEVGDIGWVFLDEELSVVDEAHEKALNIALNKISGQWNNEKLNTLLNELSMSGIDLELTGFDSLEAEQISLTEDLEYATESVEETPKEEVSEDIPIKYIKCPECGCEFK